MTPAQKKRIRAAAVEFGAALSDVGEVFHTEVRSIECTSIDSVRPHHIYIVHVTLKSDEVIA